MDRLFRKRAASTSEKKSGRRTPSSSNSSSSHHGHSHSSHTSEDQHHHNHTHNLGQGGEGGWNDHEKLMAKNGKMMLDEKAPSLNVDFRNSLILPGLSQRFSVLLPSLSTAPEESLRSLLASQRARHEGPALTVEEEELLFAEIRDAAADRSESSSLPQDRWDGQPPSLGNEWVNSGVRQFSGASGMSASASSHSHLTTSISSPSILTSSDDDKTETPTPNTPGSGWSSPPPTSNSFSSFKTFGVGTSPEQPNQSSAGPHAAPNLAAFKTKSYGFSGGSGMRDGEYLRRVKKTASHKDIRNGSVSSRKSNHSGEGGTPTRDNIPLPPAISPEKANAYYQPTKRAESPTMSERTATPTGTAISPIVNAKEHRKQGHSPSASTSFSPPNPEPTTPESPEDQMMLGKQQRARKRQSRLAGLTPAQVKRISLALEEIGGQLKRGGSVMRATQDKTKANASLGVDEVEEMLEGDAREIADNHDLDSQSGTNRRPSEFKSDESCASATSSVFPFKMSPTNSTFTSGTATEPTSPTKLHPSPKSYNLLAHVEESLPPVPVPVFTPTRSQPVRHQPSLSASSTATEVPSQAQAVYVPGQPRPIRLTHHSQSSVSSRSNTPSGQSPLDAIRSANVSPEFGRTDSTPSPLYNHAMAAYNSAPLGRSRSVNQANTTQTRPSLNGVFGEGSGPGSGSFTRRRAGTVGEQPLNGQHSSHSVLQPSTPEIIEETDEDTSDQDRARQDYDRTPDSQDEAETDLSEYYAPAIRQVTDRHSVSRSRRTESEASIHERKQSLGWNLNENDYHERTVSMQGTIISSSGSPSPSSREAEHRDPSHSDQAPQSPTTTLRRQASSGSLSSSFAEPNSTDSEVRWTEVFQPSRPESCELDTDSSPSPAKSAEMFRKMSGMGLEDLARLQEKLVDKAKLEREALRGDASDSPVIPYTPTLSSESFKPADRPVSPLLARAGSPLLARPLSPPTAWRFPSMPAPPTGQAAPAADHLSLTSTQSQEKGTVPSSTDTHIMTPPLTTTAVAPSSASITAPTTTPNRNKSIGLQSRPAPAPPVQVPAAAAVDTPSEAADDTVNTPPQTDLSRRSSTRVHPRQPLEEDPDIRRDFEARIAAATAALNRAPSVQAGGSNKLERKFTKRGGPMVISSPKLVSSTANVPTTPLTPESQGQTPENTTQSTSVESGVSKSADKSSGSGTGSKISMRWKKLAGLRNKGPNFSGSEVTPLPPPSRPPPQPIRLSPSNGGTQSQTYIQNHARTPSSLQRSQSASAAQKLDAPIDLRAMEAAPPSAPPDMKTFKFPNPPEPTAPSPPTAASVGRLPSPSFSAPVTSGLRHALSKMKRKDDKHDPARAQSQSPPADPTSSGRAQSPQSAPAFDPGSLKAAISGPVPTADTAVLPAQVPIPSAEGVGVDNQAESKHTPQSSDDIALHKFVVAGRQLGLNEEQIHAMLAAKGMNAERPTVSESANDTTSAPSTVGSAGKINPAMAHAPAPAPAPAPASPPSMSSSAFVKPTSPGKEKKGLFRALSKSRKKQNSPSPISAPVPILAPNTGLAPAAPIPETTARSEPAHDRVVVRRTMILPEGLNIIPSTPQQGSTPSIPESPEMSLAKLAQGQGRKQSIRRKPLNLSKEDQELVSNSPPAHRRKFSFGTQSGRSVSDTTVNTQSQFGTGVTTSVPTPSSLSADTSTGELHGLGFLHPHTPIRPKGSAGASNPNSYHSVSPANSMDDDSHARSSTGGSRIDMYVNADDEEEMLQSSPEKSGRGTAVDNTFSTERDGVRASVDEERRLKRQTQAVEITEYADGQVVWNIVDALRTSVNGSVDGEEYTFDNVNNPHSRNTSYSSSARNSLVPEAGAGGDVFSAAGSSAGWPRGIAAGTQGLNFRHRDRNLPSKPRPPTDIYFTSSRDVADLIDHLSQDLDASHGRINFTNFSPGPELLSSVEHPQDSRWATSNSSPFVYRDEADNDGVFEDLASSSTQPVERGGSFSSPTASPSAQFEDAPSPAPVRRAPPARISPGLPGAGIGMDISGVALDHSPRRQLFANQSLGPNANGGTHSRGQSYASNGGGLSPSAKSFASSTNSGHPGRSVEDRLQALLDRLKDSGIGRP